MRTIERYGRDPWTPAPFFSRFTKIRIVGRQRERSAREVEPNRRIVAAALSSLIAAGIAGCARPDTPANGPSGRAIEEETRALREGLIAWKEARGGVEKAAAESRLVERAIRRKAALFDLFEQSPKAALRAALRPNELSDLPDSARAHVERLVEEIGRLEVLGAVSDEGKTTYMHRLVTGRGELELFVDRMPDYQTGAELSVRGIRLEDRLAAEGEGVALLRSPDESAQDQPQAVRRALVINVNFANAPAEPWTPGSVVDLFAQQVGPWFEEVSYGQTTLDADVAGWYTLDVDTATCQSGAIRMAAMDAAAADGFDVAAYDHIVVGLARVAACHWAGLGTVGGRYTWLNNSMRLGTAVHELGHNLGLRHSHSRRCDAGPLEGTCTTSDYGDRFDTMGRGGQAEYHGAYRASIGWIPSSDITTIAAGSPDQTVQLHAVENPSGTRIVRIERAGQNNYLSVEYRAPEGFSAGLLQYDALLSGVTVYLGSAMNDEAIVDVGYSTATSADAPLPVGQTLSDPAGGVQITALDRDDQQGFATVQVHYLP